MLSGREAQDAAVRRLRALTRLARASAASDRASVARALESDASELSEFRTASLEPAALAAAVRIAYRKELGG